MCPNEMFFLRGVFQLLLKLFPLLSLLTLLLFLSQTMFVTKFLDAAFYKQGKYFSSNDNIYYPQAEVYTKVFKAMAKQYHQT